MAERPVTLADIRAAVKHPDNQGVILGGWSADSGQPLIAPLQEMGEDIIKWFNSAQGWKLVEVRTGFMNLKRIEQSSVDPSNPQAKPAILAKKAEPDQFVPCFHLDADNPLGVEYVQLAAFEGGLIPPADLQKGFAQKLSAILTKSLEAQGNSGPHSAS